MSIEKIQEIYKRIYNLDLITNDYYSMKRKLKKLGRDIAYYREEKSKIRLDGIQEKIRQLEARKEEIEQEIEINEMRGQAVLSIDDMQRFINYEKSDDELFAKCIQFFKNLLTVYDAKNNFVPVTDKIETAYIKILKICKDLDQFFQIIKDKQFFPNFKYEFTEIIEVELDGYLSTEIVFLEDSDNFYILIPMASSVLATKQTIDFPEYRKIDFQNIIVTNGYYCECLFTVLKRNLEKRIIFGEIESDEIKKNNMIFGFSKFSIFDIKQFIFEISVKSLIRECKTEIDPEDIVEIESPNGNQFISRRYFTIQKCLHRYLKADESVKKKKALVIIEKSIKVYFTTVYYEERSLFVLYSDLSSHLKDFSVFSSEFLLQLQKDLKYKLIDLSTVVDIDLSQSSLVNKALLNEIMHDFNSNMGMFVSNNRKTDFLVQFFNSLDEKLSNFVLGINCYSEYERETLKEILIFVLNQSKHLNSTSSSYRKLSSINSVVNTKSTQDAADLFKAGQIELEAFEFEILTKVFFYTR